MPLTPALMKQRLLGLCELEASLVYKRVQDGQGYTEKPCLTKRKRKKEKERKEKKTYLLFFPLILLVFVFVLI